MSVRWLVRAVFAIFYRVDRVGEPPREGPVLLLPNHPNALLDPAVVRTTDGREVRFLARSTVLQGRSGAAPRREGTLGSPLPAPGPR